VKRSLHRFEGIGIAIIVLIPAFAGLIWWLLGGQLSQIRDRLFQLPMPAAASAPALSAAPVHPVGVPSTGT